ncbi:MAG: zf-HC2 domain-containing protein [Gammaproteobacteria bacterium]|nr:zf-HC2 domain-containing protein [Gammaproteobacteria bacterium]
MLTCQEASLLVSRGLDESLPWSRRLALHMHLVLCDACRRYAGQLRWIRAAARRFPGP